MPITIAGMSHSENCYDKKLLSKVSNQRDLILYITVVVENVDTKVFHIFMYLNVSPSALKWKDSLVRIWFLSY